MKCQRCLESSEALYHAYTDLMNIKVSASCAEEARRLEIPVEVLEPRKEGGPEVHPAPPESNFFPG